MLGRKTRAQPVQYPRVPFHSVRSAQLVSSIIVSGILSYFVWQLNHDKFYIPWTYLLVSILACRSSHPHFKDSQPDFLLQLLTVSGLTTLSLLITIVLHLYTGIHPHTNMITNSILLVIWAVGFALYTWWSSGTLTHACNKQNWRNSIGIRVCQLFKVLFTFTLVGL
jgi:MFS family permease